MKFTESMIAWTSKGKTSKGNRIKVGPWPDYEGWSSTYLFTEGACNTFVHGMTKDQQIALLFIYFNALVVRELINPQEAHREFMKIDEYRDSVSSELSSLELPKL